MPRGTGMSVTKRRRPPAPHVARPNTTLADWFRWKLTQPAQPGWIPTVADFERDRHASD